MRRGWDINCWDVSASMPRVKHLLNGQDVGDLELNEPLLIIIYRPIHVDDGATVGTLVSFPRLVSCHGVESANDGRCCSCHVAN